MGLDMYLKAKVFIGADYKNDDETRPASVVEITGLTDLWAGNSRYVEVEVPVAYWRKANQIHKWFVDHVMGGIDPNDGRDYYVELDQLRTLYETCVFVLASSNMAPDMIKTGSKIGPETGGEWVDIIELGEVIVDPKVARDNLPTSEGFFFGSQEYDEGYIYDLTETVDQIGKILSYFDKPDAVIVDLWYNASW